jgi:hypothetical protein
MIRAEGFEHDGSSRDARERAKSRVVTPALRTWPRMGGQMPKSSSLKKDFRVFRDPGFLVTLLIMGFLCALGAYILIQANNRYGISVRPYWDR